MAEKGPRRFRGIEQDYIGSVFDKRRLEHAFGDIRGQHLVTVDHSKGNARSRKALLEDGATGPAGEIEQGLSFGKKCAALRYESNQTQGVSGGDEYLREAGFFRRFRRCCADGEERF
ncbi:hypothetical protein D3C78_1466360 [compost metagenome]